MRFFFAGKSGTCAYLVLSLGAGCQTDSFVDPTVTGRWEHQPTTLPILRKINAIEIGEQVVGETPTR